ncbi:MAG: CBS domain-containing protein [Candidatus Zixiibacteriota bacterium]|nr:MAG: CBS domain-containing protein [candidate division Zixibacteria bacterium]
MKLEDILKSKGNGFESIEPDRSVKEAMHRIAEKKIGSLLVMKNDLLVGIITEKDIFRITLENGEKAFSQPVEKFMTTNPVIGIPEDDVETAMAYMTNNRFRHLPVMHGNKVVGIVSIGDIIKAQAKNLRSENRYLVDYITGKYPS